jgi:hypothetical protein
MLHFVTDVVIVVDLAGMFAVGGAGAFLRTKVGFVIGFFVPGGLAGNLQPHTVFHGPFILARAHELLESEIFDNHSQVFFTVVVIRMVLLGFVISWPPPQKSHIPVVVTAHSRNKAIDNKRRINMDTIFISDIDRRAKEFARKKAEKSIKE